MMASLRRTALRITVMEDTNGEFPATTWTVRAPIARTETIAPFAMRLRTPGPELRMIWAILPVLMVKVHDKERRSESPDRLMGDASLSLLEQSLPA